MKTTLEGNTSRFEHIEEKVQPIPCICFEQKIRSFHYAGKIWISKLQSFGYVNRKVIPASISILTSTKFRNLNLSKVNDKVF